MKPKLLFVYEHKHPEWLVADGLWSALGVLEKDFEIKRYNIGLEKALGPITLLNPDKHNFILGWGAFGSAVDGFIKRSKSVTGIPSGLCIAGNATPTEGAEKYDVLFYETDWINNNYLPSHPNKVKAFGINTDIFSKPTIATPIVWDYIGVGAFASWKRWEKMVDKKGIRLVVGEVQEGNLEESMDIITHLVINGVMVSPQVSPFDLVNYYSYARTLYMPSDIYGGGERTVLEARSCGLNVEIEPDNEKLKELLTCEIPSHIEYAEILKTNILKLI